MNAILDDPVMNLSELRDQFESESATSEFIDDVDYLLNHFVMIHGTDCVFDHVAGRLMKVAHLRLSAPNSYKDWQASSNRQIVDVDRVTFDPVNLHQGNTINLFRGIKMRPTEGDCGPIIDLLLTLCNQDMHLAQWVTCWIAYPLQHVGAKMQTSIVMRGWKNGTGKNLFWENVISKIYGHYGQTIDQQDVEGAYNGWASSKLFIVADEVVSPGEKWHIKGALKRMITGDTIRISEKYLPTRTERNHCNFVFLSNENIPLPVDSDDRRYTVIEPSIKQSREYYTDIAKCIENGGAEAFYHYLLHYDLNGFTSHSLPVSNDDKRTLIEMSMRSHERFVHDWVAGLTPFDFQPVYSDAIYLAYQVWCKRNGERPTNLNTLCRELQKFVTSMRKMHLGTQTKKTLYIPNGYTEKISWLDMDDFYTNVRNLAEMESKIRL